MFERILYPTDFSDVSKKALDYIKQLKEGGAQKRIQLRQTAVFYKADPDYGRRVAEGLGLDVKEIERLAAISQEERLKATAQES
jgi:catalase